MDNQDQNNDNYKEDDNRENGESRSIAGNRHRNIAGRYIFLGVSLIAIMVLGVYITSSSRTLDENDGVLDVNGKYSIKRNKETVGEIDVYYPTVTNMTIEKVQDKINDVLIKQKDIYVKMARNNTLLNVDYKVTFSGDNVLSILFFGDIMLKEKASLMKGYNFNVNTGEQVKLVDFIDEEVIDSNEFKNLINKKVKSQNIGYSKIIKKDADFYLESNINSINYVFFFNDDKTSTAFKQIKISQSEIEGIIYTIRKNDTKENNKNNDNTNENNTNSNTKTDEEKNNGITKVEILALDKKDKQLTSHVVNINGKDINMNTQSQLYLLNNRIMIPLVEIASKTGYEVKSLGEDRYQVTNGSDYINLVVGEDRYFYTQITPFKLGEKVTKKDDVIYVPIEFLTLVLDMDVKVKDNKVYIISQADDTKELEMA